MEGSRKSRKVPGAWPLCSLSARMPCNATPPGYLSGTDFCTPAALLSTDNSHALPAPLAQALQAARERLAAGPSGGDAGAVLAELAVELAGAEVAKAMTADTKDLHGAVGKLGKASVFALWGGRGRNGSSAGAGRSARRRQQTGRQGKCYWEGAALLPGGSSAGCWGKMLGAAARKKHLLPSALLPPSGLWSAPSPRTSPRPVLYLTERQFSPQPEQCDAFGLRFLAAGGGARLLPGHLKSLQGRPPARPGSTQPGGVRVNVGQGGGVGVGWFGGRVRATAPGHPLDSSAANQACLSLQEAFCWGGGLQGRPPS